MKRFLLATALIAFATAADAQQPQLPAPQQIPRQTPTLPPPTLGSATFVYTATTGAPVRRSGSVTAGTLTWTCSGTTCTIRGPWPQPGVAACAALAREIGRIVSYGRPGAMLNAAQLTQCNGNLSLPPPPSPPPPPPPPAPGIEIATSLVRAEGSPLAHAPPPTGSFTPVDITTSTVRAEGSPEAMAPPTGPFPPIDITTSTVRAEGAPP